MHNREGLLSRRLQILILNPAWRPFGLKFGKWVLSRGDTRRYNTYAVHSHCPTTFHHQNWGWRSSLECRHWAESPSGHDTSQRLRPSAHSQRATILLHAGHGYLPRLASCMGGRRHVGIGAEQPILWHRLAWPDFLPGRHTVFVPHRRPQNAWRSRNICCGCAGPSSNLKWCTDNEWPLNSCS